MVHTRIIAVLLVLLMPLPGLAGDDDKGLRKAVEAGDKTKVQEALAKGADVNAADKNGVTALMIAADKGYAEIVQVLLEAGADVTAQNNQGATAAILAEMSGHPDIAKRLAAGVGDTVGELPCASVNLAGRKEKEDEQVHFFAAPLPRVREVLSDSMMTVGFVVTKEQSNTLVARRKHPELSGGGG